MSPVYEGRENCKSSEHEGGAHKDLQDSLCIRHGEKRSRRSFQKLLGMISCHALASDASNTIVVPESAISEECDAVP